MGWVVGWRELPESRAQGLESVEAGQVSFAVLLWARGGHHQQGRPARWQQPHMKTRPPHPPNHSLAPPTPPTCAAVELLLRQDDLHAVAVVGGGDGVAHDAHRPHHAPRLAHLQCTIGVGCRVGGWGAGERNGIARAERSMSRKPSKLGRPTAQLQPPAQTQLLLPAQAGPFTRPLTF